MIRVAKGPSRPNLASMHGFQPVQGQHRDPSQMANQRAATETKHEWVNQGRSSMQKKVENTPSHEGRIAKNLHNVCTDDTFRGATDRPKGRSFAEGIERSSGEHNVFSYIIAAEASDIPCGPPLTSGFFLRRSLHMQGLDNDKWECLRLTVVKMVLWPVSILLGLWDALSYIVYEEPSDYRAAPPGTIPLRHIPILKVSMDRRRRPPH